MNLIASHQLYCLSFLTVSADSPKVMTEPVKGCQQTSYIIFITCIKTESIRKLTNFNFQWIKTLYQNNLKNIEFFFTFLTG